MILHRLSDSFITLTEAFGILQKRKLNYCWTNSTCGKKRSLNYGSHNSYRVKYGPAKLTVSLCDLYNEGKVLMPDNFRFFSMYFLVGVVWLFCFHIISIFLVDFFLCLDQPISSKWEIDLFRNNSLLFYLNQQVAMALEIKVIWRPWVLLLYTASATQQHLKHSSFNAINIVVAHNSINSNSSASQRH